jgi:hypothetical protein
LASQFTSNAETLALNWLFTAGAVTRPTAWYVALSTTTPTTTGSNTTEPSGNGYARQAVAFAAASGNPASTANTGILTFTASGGDWGTITYITLFDAVSAGNSLAIGQLTTSKLIQNGDSLQFAVSAITITLT